MRLEEMERTELIDFFVTQISGNEKEVEIAYVLATYAANKLSRESAAKHDATELDTDELIDLIETGILNQNGAGYDEEERAWGMVLDSLKPDKIFDIIENNSYYMDKFNDIIKPLEHLQRAMLRTFIESEVSANG